MKKLITTVLLLLCFLATISPGYASKQFGHRFGPPRDMLASAAPKLGIRAAWYHSPTTARNYVKTAGSPGIWKDSSGGNHTLTVGSELESPASASRGVDFDGDNDYLITGVDLTRGSSPETMIIHFVRDAETADWLFCGVPNAGFNVGIAAAVLYVTDTSQISVATCTVAPGAASYTIGVEFSGGGMASLYKNGVFQFSGNVGSILGPSDRIEFGVWGAGSKYYYFDGAIDGILYYGRSLTAAEHAASPNWF